MVVKVWNNVPRSVAVGLETGRRPFPWFAPLFQGKGGVRAPSRTQLCREPGLRNAQRRASAHSTTRAMIPLLSKA